MDAFMTTDRRPSVTFVKPIHCAGRA